MRDKFSYWADNLVVRHPSTKLLTLLGLVALHLEFFYKRGAAIFCVQMRDDESLGQLRERTVRVRVLLENPAMHPSYRVEHVNKDGLALRLGRRQRLGKIRDGLGRRGRAGAEHQPAGDEHLESCCRKFHLVTFFL